MTLVELARELGAQSYEVAAFGGLGNVSDNSILTPDTIDVIREAWALTDNMMTTEMQNRAEEAVLDALFEIAEGAGYDE